MEPNAQQNLQINKKRSRSWKKLVIIILALLLLAAAGALGYLYWIERQKSQKLQAQADQLKAASKQESDKASQPATPGKATYAATVGKFTLTLDELYYIIVDLDGGFEGGPATRLDIGTRNDSGTQAISSPHHARVTVAAYPLSGGNTYESRVEAAMDESPGMQKQAGMTVGGVNADVYQIDGLFTDKKVFFTKNNIFYEITAGSADTTDGILNAVVKGFKFNG